jgi:hypothetical protein
MSDLFQPEIATDLRAQQRVREWIAALRSRKYRQGRERLRTSNGFCCLGVACDLFNDHIWRPAAGDAEWRYLGAGIDLPRPITDAYRLRRMDGQYTRDDGSAASLAEDNDAGRSFTEIAEVIERELGAALGAARESGR